MWGDHRLPWSLYGANPDQLGPSWGIAIANSEVKQEAGCPVCNAIALRAYRYAYSANVNGFRGREVAITYVWCSSCHRYRSATGPKVEDLGDPMGVIRLGLDASVESVLVHLDNNWGH
jgi:hypothetical protein